MSQKINYRIVKPNAQERNESAPLINKQYKLRKQQQLLGEKRKQLNQEVSRLRNEREELKKQADALFSKLDDFSNINGSVVLKQRINLKLLDYSAIGSFIAGGITILLAVAFHITKLGETAAKVMAGLGVAEMTLPVIGGAVVDGVTKKIEKKEINKLEQEYGSRQSLQEQYDETWHRIHDIDDKQEKVYKEIDKVENKIYWNNRELQNIGEILAEQTQA